MFCLEFIPLKRCLGASITGRAGDCGWWVLWDEVSERFALCNWAFRSAILFFWMLISSTLSFKRNSKAVTLLACLSFKTEISSLRPMSRLVRSSFRRRWSATPLSLVSSSTRVISSLASARACLRISTSPRIGRSSLSSASFSWWSTWFALISSPKSPPRISLRKLSISRCLSKSNESKLRLTPGT